MMHAMRVVLLCALMVPQGCTTLQMWGDPDRPKPHLHREEVSDLLVRLEPGVQPESLRLVAAAGDEPIHGWVMTPSRHAELAQALMDRPALFALQRADLNAYRVVNESTVLQHDAELLLLGTISFDNCRVPLGQLVPARCANMSKEVSPEQQLGWRRAETFLPQRLVQMPDPLRECAFYLLEIERAGKRVAAFTFVASDRKLSPNDGQPWPSNLSGRLCGLRQFDVVVRFAESRTVHRLRCDWLLLAGEAGGFGPLVHRSRWQLHPVVSDVTRRPAFCDGSVKLTKQWYRLGAGWDMPVWQKALATPFTLAADSIYLPIVAAGVGIGALVLWGYSCSVSTYTR